jgi:hypothetical protein
LENIAGCIKGDCCGELRFRSSPFLKKALLFIKFRIERIEVFAVQLFLDDSQAFSETLVVYDLTLP